MILHICIQYYLLCAVSELCYNYDMVITRSDIQAIGNVNVLTLFYWCYSIATKGIAFCYIPCSIVVIIMAVYGNIQVHY